MWQCHEPPGRGPALPFAPLHIQVLSSGSSGEPPGKVFPQKCQSFVSSLQGHPLLLLCWDQTQVLKLQVLIQRLGRFAQVQNATTNFANVTAN